MAKPVNPEIIGKRLAGRGHAIWVVSIGRRQVAQPVSVWNFAPRKPMHLAHRVRGQRQLHPALVLQRLCRHQATADEKPADDLEGEPIGLLECSDRTSASTTLGTPTLPRTGANLWVVLVEL